MRCECCGETIKKGEVYYCFGIDYQCENCGDCYINNCKFINSDNND